MYNKFTAAAVNCHCSDSEFMSVSAIQNESAAKECAHEYDSIRPNISYYAAEILSYARPLPEFDFL